MNLTGSPDYGARVRLVGDPGEGCSSNLYSQFNTSAFQGPLYNSVGLESGAELPEELLHERARPGGGAEHPPRRRPQHPAARRHVQRAELRPSSPRRNTTMNLTSPNDPVTITNPQQRRERQPAAERASGRIRRDLARRPTSRRRGRFSYRCASRSKTERGHGEEAREHGDTPRRFVARARGAGVGPRASNAREHGEESRGFEGWPQRLNLGTPEPRNLRNLATEQSEFMWSDVYVDPT